MRKILLLMLACVLINTANAQEMKNKSGKHHGTTPTPEVRAQKQTDRLEKELTLTADQKPKVYNAVLTKNKKVAEVREKYKNEADKSKAREEIKTIRKDFVAEMTTVLTPEQLTKWKEIRKNNKKGNGHQLHSPKANPKGDHSKPNADVEDENEDLDD